MRRLTVFNNVSLDGYFTDLAGDMSWAHNQDPEWQAFTEENASLQGEMIFGRKTYELMASFWPTPQAEAMMPTVAAAMNQSPKIVFSRTLDAARWRNTRLIKDDPALAVTALKREAGPDLLVMGSGTIVSQLADAGLVDEFLIVVHPLALGGGRTLFEGVHQRLLLKRTATRSFGNGNVLLRLESVGAS